MNDLICGKLPSVTTKIISEFRIFSVTRKYTYPLAVCFCSVYFDVKFH